MADFEGIEYTEIWPGSPKEKWANDGVSVTRRFKVAWDSRHEFCKLLVGYPKLMGSGANAYVSRVTPDYYAIAGSETDSCYCTSAEVEGHGTPDDDEGQEDVAFPVRTTTDEAGVCLYKIAVIQATYESLDYDILEDEDVNNTEVNLDRYVVEHEKPSVEYLTFVKGSWAFKTGTSPPPVVSFPIPKTQASKEITWIWKHVPMIPSSVDTAPGTVNDATFAGYAAGTLLCLAADVKPIRSATGGRIYDIAWKVKYLSVGHNFFLRFFAGSPPADPVYTEVTSNGLDSGKRPYDKSDFRKMFRPV